MDGDSEPETENSLLQVVVQVVELWVPAWVAMAIAITTAIVMIMRYFIVHKMY
jgi:hypothetical protein